VHTDRLHVCTAEGEVREFWKASSAARAFMTLHQGNQPFEVLAGSSCLQMAALMYFRSRLLAVPCFTSNVQHVTNAANQNLTAEYAAVAGH
jgi:hypothetical protein